MARELIYKDEARSAVLHEHPAIAFCIDRVKAVDAVEVVRCKDCKYYLRDDMFGGGYCHGERVKQDDFCSYGERRNE
jgi:hypothetical protein